MPISNFYHFPAVLHFVCYLKPLKILDVGVGLGTYGLAMREYLDICYQRLNKSEWKIKIDGIEVFESYRNPIWDYAYDRIILSDIRNVIDTLDEYDLILCSDVLEHFEREEAQNIAQKLLERTSTLIITTPNREYPQGEWAGNEAETHHCLLKASDFPNLVTQTITGETTCYVCSKDRKLHQFIEYSATDYLANSSFIPQSLIKFIISWKYKLIRLIEKLLSLFSISISYFKTTKI